MGLYVSRNLVLEFDPWDEGGNGNFPVIGWHNLVTIDNVTASYAAADYPVTNLANPNTASRWQSTHGTTTQYLTFEISSGEAIDYIGLARHNLGSTGANVSVQVQAPGSTNWTPVIEERVLPSDAPAILRFVPQPVQAVRLKIVPQGTPPRLAVAYVGKLLVMERGLQNGHVPIHLAAQDEIVTGLAESGDFLGRIVTGQALETGVSFRFLRKDWFDAEMLPFVRAGLGRPFFFGWLPEDYPDEAAFCWRTSDIRPEAQMMARGVYLNIDFQMGALVL